MYLPRKEGTRLLEQFEGYFELDNVTIEKYDENDWPVRPDALKTKRARETQINKQADVVMLLHLMGNEFDEETIKENYAYYEKRTLHGSSLSPSIFSVMGLKVGDDSKAYRYLRRAAFIDLLNMQGNTKRRNPCGKYWWSMADNCIWVCRCSAKRRWYVESSSEYAKGMAGINIPSAL